MDSYVDYQISNMFFANYDWPGNNIKYWRIKDQYGRWKWIFYDLDWSFWDFKYDMFSHCTNIDENCCWMNPIMSTYPFRKLLDYSQFKNEFVTRASQILNEFALNQNYNDTDIKNLPWVVREVGSGTRRLLEYFMNSRQIEWDEVNIALELPSNEAVRQAVESGAGIALLSEYVVNSSVKSGLLKLIPVELPVRKFRLITHKNRKFSNVSQAFIEMLKPKSPVIT